MVWWVPCGRTPVRSPRARLAGAVKATPTDGSPAWPLQPFAPFSKNDRVGRACEWNFTRERERFRREWQRYDRQGEPSPFVMEQVDEEGFHLVEQKTPAKPKWGPGARGGRGGMRGGMRYAACAAKRVRQRGRCDGASHSRGGLCSRVVLTELSVFFPPVRVLGRVQTFVRAFVCRCLLSPCDLYLAPAPAVSPRPPASVRSDPRRICECNRSPRIRAAWRRGAMASRATRKRMRRGRRGIRLRTPLRVPRRPARDVSSSASRVDVTRM